MDALIYTLVCVLGLGALAYSALHIKRFSSKRRVFKFAASVGGALRDLDMRAEMLPPDLNRTFLYECVMKCRDTNGKADPRALALDLFLRFFMAYSAQMKPHDRIALIEHSIRQARQWQETEALEEISDEFVETIKEIFIDEMAAYPLPRADRSETVSRIMSL